MSFRSTMSQCLLAAVCLTLLPTENLLQAEPAEQIQIVAEDAAGKVVKLFGAGIGNLDSYGSGTLVSADGHVLTVWNHLINTGYLTAVTADGTRYEVDVIGTSADHDLAVLQLQDTADRTFPFVDLNQAVSSGPGRHVLAFSNMFHVATGNEPVSVVHGIVAAEAPLAAGFGRWKFPLKSPVLIVDAVTNNSGAAGGLLTDRQGHPLGLLGRELRHELSGTWVNYAVPFATLRPVVNSLLQGDTIAAQQTKSTVAPLSDRQLTANWGMTLLPDVVHEPPAWIDRVIAESPVGRAGLQRGDLVVLVNDEVIRTTTQLRTQLATIRSGLKLTLTVSRGNTLKTLPLRAP